MRLYYAQINEVFCLIFAESWQDAVKKFNDSGVYVDERQVNEFSDGFSWFIENAIKKD